MQRIRIVGVGRTQIGKLKTDSITLAKESIKLALKDASLTEKHIESVVATPSFASPHVMQAHHIATAAGLFKSNPNVLCRTIDCGGASPISCIGSAVDIIRNGWANVAAIVCSDAVYSMGSKAFADRAVSGLPDPDIPEPHIPNSYSLYAEWQMRTYGLTREQLAMVTVLMSSMAARHPDAMCRKPYTLEEVLGARKIAPTINLFECARRADGAVTLLVTSEDHYKKCVPGAVLDASKPLILGLGESSGPMAPPRRGEEISPETFSVKKAAKLAYDAAKLQPKDIGFFGLYDCFPICFIRALESVGICAEGEGGKYVETAYNAMLKNNGVIDPNTFPINTHGGLMCFGAPWEVPAMYNITEGIAQLSGKAGNRQVSPAPKYALAYGNGGILTASSVMIMGS